MQRLPRSPYVPQSAGGGGVDGDRRAASDVSGLDARSLRPSPVPGVIVRFRIHSKENNVSTSSKVSNSASRRLRLAVTLAMAFPSVVFAGPPEQRATPPSLGNVEHPHSAVHTSGLVLKTADANIKAHLAELRRATAAYHDINGALADGFLLGINGGVTLCVAHATLGAMGYHYSRQDRFDDAAINELEPEVLVYHTAKDGSLKLGAVEWVVPKAAWEALHGAGAPPPVVYGIALTVINPTLNWYVAHAWIWKPNPTGILMDWNPKVTCP